MQRLRIKKTIVRAAMMLLMLLTTATAWAQDPASIGSIQYNSTLGAYEINSVQNLNDLAVYVNGRGTYSTSSDETTAHSCEGLTFKQTADITYTGTGNYTPIGLFVNDDGFQGTFDGQGNTISGIDCTGDGLTGEEESLGLFGQNQGTVRNVTLSGCRFASANDENFSDNYGNKYAIYVGIGSIAGINYRTGSITGCTVTGGTVSRTRTADADDFVTYIGGIAGENHGSITDCTYSGSVSGTYSGSQTNNCAFHIGGIAGISENGGSITGCGSDAAVSCSAPNVYDPSLFVGGIAGLNNGMHGDTTVSDCFFSGTLSGTGKTGGSTDSIYIGAFVGRSINSSIVTNNYYYGDYASTIGYEGGNGTLANLVRVYQLTGNSITATAPEGSGTTFKGVSYFKADATVTLGHADPAAGYLFDGYTVNGAAIDGNTFTMGTANATVDATFAPDPAHFSDDGNNQYTIHTAAGWGVFCDMLANSDKGYFTGKTVKLGNDIQISRAAGLDQHDFTGTFDGQGNTIKLAFGTSQNRYTEHAAVFRNTEWASSEQYAKIQNLNVNGTIYTASNVIYDAGLVAKAFGGLEISNCTSDVIINTSNQFAGGFVGYNQGKLDIVNCRSNATIYSTVNGDGTHGGFVGNHHSDELTIEGCVFTGKLLTTATNSTAYCGGFVGWCNTATTIKNCLYAPAIIDTEHGETEVQAGTGDYTSCTFARKSTATVTITNSYYTRTLGTGQGKAARTITAGEYVTIEAVSPIGSSVENGTYSVSGITAYAKGITRGDAFYYGNGDEVSLTLSHADRGGYTFTGYSASAGTLDGTTLTMPGDGDVTINANYEFIKFTQGALSYECTSGTEVKVTACNTSATSVTIPATVTDNNVTYTVTAIAADAFSGCTALTTVIMEPTTPPTLGNDAFANCNELANIYVPAGTSGAYKTAWADYASKIEDYGTCGTNVYWSYNSTSHKLTIFGTGAMADYSYSNRPWFSFRTDITTVDIRNGVTTIGEDAFDGCNALTNISIPTSVTSIGDYAFSNCYSLSSIELPTSLTSICKGTFNTCKSLTSITIPAGVTSIDDQAFEWCTALTSIDLPASVTSIGYFAFSLCTALSSIELPTSLTTICEKAFEACTSLTSITIPASVTRIDSYAFVKCSSLESISVAEGNTVYDSRNGCNAIIIKESNKLLLGCKNTVIPTGVTSIGKEAFYKCTGLTSITIPESVTSIGEEAFESCNSLTTVIMQPTTPPTLGNDVFENCDELANIYVPAGTTETYKTTGNWATYKDIIQTGGACGTNVYWSYNSDSKTLTIFGTGDMTNDFESNNWENYLNDITTVNISNGVTSIGDYAFSFCTGLTSIEIPASVKTIGNYAFQGCWGLTSIEIPASVTSIGYAAFITCIYLTSINIPASVTTIGGDAFANCTGLTSINIPASVTSIGYSTFLNCISLESISVAAGNTIYDSRINCNALIETASNTLMLGCKNTVIPNTVTSIGDYAFDGCEELKEITIPASVTSIGNYAFYGCSALESISVANGNTKYDSRNDCNALIETASNTLMLGCKNTVIPNTVTSIGDYAFHGCEELKEITIPASVKTIGKETFYYCTGLTSITIPASVTSIGNWAFAYCTSLTTVFMEPTTPPTLGNYVFNACDELDAIYVPAGTSGDYKAAWTDYAGKIKGLDEITEIALVDNADNSGLITGVNGLTLNVTLQDRTLYKDGDWNTLVLPFNVTADELDTSNHPLHGTTIMELDVEGYYEGNTRYDTPADGRKQTGYDATTGTLNLYFKPVYDYFFPPQGGLKAGKPYLISWAKAPNYDQAAPDTRDLKNPEFTGVTIDNTDRSVTSSDGYVTFKGTYDRLEWNTENNSILFLGANNTLYWPQPSNNQTPYLNAFRAYFQLNNGLTAADVSAARMNFDGENEVNGVKEVNATLGVNDDSWYTLNGVKLSGKPTKAGLYIHNGKKVIIK